MQQQAEVRVPVLVVGGSLVGLSTSLFLGRLGIEHMLVERHAGTSMHPRGRGNNVRTMELFRTAGVDDPIREAGRVLAENHGILQTPSLTGGGGEWLIKEVQHSSGASRFSPAPWCVCSQNDLEPVLLEYATKYGGDLRFSTELRSFEQDEGGVTAVVEDRMTGRLGTVRADYLVAADGPRSPVRERLGIGRSGPGDLFHNVSITFRSRGLAAVVGDRRFIVCYLTDPAADGALLPVDNAENWVFHAPWQPQTGETIEDFTDERCITHIRRATGALDLDVEITGKAPWHAAERVAERYADGRVFLAGDSAHEMSPTGAFGSNTGIQDAHNLAWKLAAVLRGHAGPGLLDTYDAERRPVAMATSKRASVRSEEHSHPGYAPAPGGGGKQSGMLTVALGYRYRSGAVLGADPELPIVPQQLQLTGEPGSRAPHLWVRRGGESGMVSTLDLYERSFVLLTDAGPGGGAWHAAGVDAAARLRVPLDVYRIGEGPGADLVPETGVDWRAAHGTTGEGALLVRPDGFVAWRSPGSVPDPEAVLSDVLESLLHRSPTGRG
ncbi:putative polyketide hydroxylase [Streptomyces sp. V4I23]|uniref:FAD-dependent oxidoreductase n=1 Tax=Streptomyces sp. V4I23 TaxID=3042282 RepID=UPI002783EDF6|nr:FAD-dependent monooxygenase [Streptomyces sp. V4I23]MDQ1007744.1 putative polyketide hydroxylase [Streptomyces sp. V4I23]